MRLPWPAVDDASTLSGALVDVQHVPVVEWALVGGVGQHEDRLGVAAGHPTDKRTLGIVLERASVGITEEMGNDGVGGPDVLPIPIQCLRRHLRRVIDKDLKYADPYSSCERMTDASVSCLLFR